MGDRIGIAAFGLRDALWGFFQGPPQDDGQILTDIGQILANICEILTKTYIYIYIKSGICFKRACQIPKNVQKKQCALGLPKHIKLTIIVLNRLLYRVS